MARPKAQPIPYSAPKKDEPALLCDGCSRLWAITLAVPALKKCRNCARTWWRDAQAAHRAGAAAPPLRVARREVGVVPPNIRNVDAFLVEATKPPPEKRGSRPREVQHAPESIESMVGRLGSGDVIDVPLLPAPEGKRRM